MPIYEYLCDGCCHRFERWQRISDGPIASCPSCESPRVQRLISATSFSLKGTGWYVTDYKKPRSTSTSESSNGSTGSAATSSE